VIAFGQIAADYLMKNDELPEVVEMLVISLLEQQLQTLPLHLHHPKKLSFNPVTLTSSHIIVLNQLNTCLKLAKHGKKLRLA